MAVTQGKTRKGYYENIHDLIILTAKEKKKYEGKVNRNYKKKTAKRR